MNSYRYLSWPNELIKNIPSGILILVNISYFSFGVAISKLCYACFISRLFGLFLVSLVYKILISYDSSWRHVCLRFLIKSHQGLYVTEQLLRNFRNLIFCDYIFTEFRKFRNVQLNYSAVGTTNSRVVTTISTFHRL